MTPARFWRHLRALWPGLSILAPLPFVAPRGLGPVAAPVPLGERGHARRSRSTLFSVGPRTKKLFIGVYPLGLVGLLYDAMKLFENVGVTPESVHLCDLRALEIRLFGVTMNGQPGTLHDWFQAALVAAPRPPLRHPLRDVHLRVHRHARSGSTSRTTRRCCASPGASSR